MRVAELIDIVEEPTTAVLLRNAKSITRPENCFAVVTSDRTLDLEADTPELKAQWVLALLALKRYRGGL